MRKTKIALKREWETNTLFITEKHEREYDGKRNRESYLWENQKIKRTNEDIEMRMKYGKTKGNNKIKPKNYNKKEKL